MPYWLRELLSRRNGWFWLDSNLSHMNAVQFHVRKQPKGHWLIGLAITSKGKYRKDQVNLYCSNGDGTLYQLRMSIELMENCEIIGLDALEKYLIARGTPLVRGGFIDYRAYELSLLAMYLPPDDWDDGTSEDSDSSSDEDIASSISSLRSSGGASPL